MNEQMMRLAISEARESEGSVQVGVVIEKDGTVLAQAHKGERGTEHAEAIALAKAREAGLGVSSAGANRFSCAQLLADADIAAVYIGSYDRNPSIYRMGWRILRDAGINLYDFPPGLREEVSGVGRSFDTHFIRRVGLIGKANFDYSQNGGKCDLAVSDEDGSPVWTTSWGECGADSIYANGGHPGVVALARFAREFSEIDDPGAYDYGSHFAKAQIGDIVIFRNAYGYALIKVTEVEAGPTRGTAAIRLRFEYQLRLVQ
jgi:diaminohydroxyphosphoribosylaminopyrimidine deaminase/5-amino-6-(5-phosphoribosylamino)uracil reductase